METSFNFFSDNVSGPKDKEDNESESTNDSNEDVASWIGDAMIDTNSSFNDTD